VILHRFRAGAAVAVVLVGLAAGCSSDSPTTTSGSTSGATSDSATGTPNQGGAVVIARGAPSDGWDGEHAFTATTYNTLSAVFGSLLRGNPSTNQIEGYLAREFAYTDPTNTTLQLTLAPGVAFSDGRPLTSADVKFSLELWKSSKNYGAFVASIDTIDTPDPQTVVVHLKARDNFLLSALTQSPIEMLPKDFGGKSRDEFFEKPIGAGPFMIESETVGQEIVLVRNPHYFEPGKPYLDRLTLRTISDSNQRLLQFQNGQVDILDGVPLDQMAQLGDHVTLVDASLMQFLGANWNNVGADASFRKALSLAIDRQKLVTGVLDGNGAVPHSVLAPAALDQPAPSKGKVDAYDPTAAKAALAQSSYKGEELEILYDSGRGIAALLAQAVQQQLADVGIKTKLAGADTQTYVDRWSNTKDFQLIVATTYAVSPSPADTLSYQGFLEWLYMGAPGDAADAAYAKWNTATSQTDQTSALQDIENWAVDNIPYTPLVLPKLAYAVQSGVDGFTISRLNFYEAENIFRA
jgi:ABC-type transport system substrate-binding protein